MSRLLSLRGRLLGLRWRSCLDRLRGHRLRLLILLRILRLGNLRLPFNILSCLLEFLIEFLACLAEFVHALPKAPGKLRQLLRAEEHQDNNQNQHPL